MKNIATYRYCYDEDKNLISIDDVNKENRHQNKYYCIGCGNQMNANLGNIKIHYFSHKKDCSCNGETYLHRLAKRRIRDKFLSAEHFPVTFIRDIPCREKDKCSVAGVDDYGYNHCYKTKEIPIDLKKWKGEDLYDTCEEEASVGNFRADLLLSNSKKTDIPPVLIEVQVTHESSYEKLTSGLRIIETTIIKSEEDIDHIIENGFVECSVFSDYA